MSKFLVLTREQEKELIAKKEIVVKVKGLNYRVFMTDDKAIHVESANNTIRVCDPSKYDIVLTYQELKELKETGKTTHTKAGKEYYIILDNGEIKASVKCDYTMVILNSQR